MRKSIDRVRKSEKLTPEEHEALKMWIGEQATKIDAAILIGLTGPTLDRIYHAGSGRPLSIAKIRQKITPNQ